MTEAEEPDAFVCGATLPRGAASPRKTTCFNGPQRKPFPKPRINLVPQPSQILKLLSNSQLWVVPDHDTREIRNIGSHCMNMSVPFNQNLDIQIQQTLKALKPSSTVYVGVGSCKVASHECVSC